MGETFTLSEALRGLSISENAETGNHQTISVVHELNKVHEAGCRAHAEHTGFRGGCWTDCSVYPTSRTNGCLLPLKDLGRDAVGWAYVMFAGLKFVKRTSHGQSPGIGKARRNGPGRFKLLRGVCATNSIYVVGLSVIDCSRFPYSIRVHTWRADEAPECRRFADNGFFRATRTTERFNLFGSHGQSGVNFDESRPFLPSTVRT